MNCLNKIFHLMLVLSLTSGCAIYHHYGAYYGKVVDAETKQPLEGAVVLADYYTWLHASPGGPSVYFLDAQEVVTDANGEFRIPSLNAFAFRPLSTFNDYADITIFKPRYKCFTNQLRDNFPENVGLTELKIREERLANHCMPTGVPKYRMRKFIEVVNTEEVELGLTPYTIK